MSVVGGIDPGARIGHVHLKVSDLDRSIAWYGAALGLDLMQRYGDSAAFLSAGGYHHHVGLNTWFSAGASRAEPRGVGLFHLALLYPTRPALATAVARVLDHGTELTGAADHGVSEAVYLDDPDGNGVELYWDRPREEWPRPPTGEGVEMFTAPLDLGDLLALAR